MTYNILLVEDDVAQAHLLQQMIQDQWKYKTQVINNGQEALELLTSKKADQFDLVLLDISSQHLDGMRILNDMKPIHPDLPVIVRTAHDDIELAVQMMKAGATDYLTRTDNPERLQQSIVNALRVHVLHDELTKLKRAAKSPTSFEDIIGKSQAVEEVKTLGAKVAASNIPVLIEGESGVGKELLARAIHVASDRADKPFMAVNCGAIPENLVESILFGHEKGAFTGALYKTVGKFREADGGTLFLDEVGELTPELQVKLLRVLQDGEIEPVGASQTVKVDIRLISATNRKLGLEVAENRFREDLFYRLNVFPIHIPSLKERPEDITELLTHFQTRFAEAEGKAIEGISEEAVNLLHQYHWPGNIRQLKNTLFRSVVLCEGVKLDVDDFPQLAKEVQSNDAQANGVIDGVLPFVNGKLHVPLVMDGEIRKFHDVEEDIIKAAIEFHNGCMSKVARSLGIGRSTLYRKLENIDIVAQE